MANVAIGIGGKIDAQEAAKILGCSYSHIINLINAHKFKAQRIGKKWLLDSDEIYKAKASGFVKNKPRKIRLGTTQFLQDEPKPGNTFIRLEVDKEKIELIKLAFQGTDKTLVSFLNGKIDDLYEQIKEKLKGMNL